MRTVSIRTKLLAATLLPLFLIGAIAAQNVIDRQSALEDMGIVADSVDDSLLVSDTLVALANERDWSV